MRVQVVEKFLDISSFNHVKRMEQLCAPLKKIGIECFAYVEYLNGNKMRWLINDVIFLELWAEFERSCFSHSAFSNQLTDKSGLYFLDSIYSIKPPCLTPEFFECCDVATGVAIVEREKAIKRVYFFSSNNVARFHANYHQLQALFYRFINFFKREARDLIMQSNYFLIPKAYLDVAQCLEYPKLLLSSDVNAFLEVVADKQHSLEKIASQYQLTYREQECLSHLLKGASAKQVAEAMGISLRTAEHHIQNVREKTQSPSIKDLLIKMAVTMAQQGEDQHVYGLTDDFAKHSVFEYLPAMQRLVKPLRTLGISQIGCIFLDPPYHVQYLGDSELFFNEWLNTGDDTFKYDAFLSPAMSTPGWHLLAPYMALPDTDVMRNILDLCAIEVGAAYINYVQGQKQVFIFCSDQPIKFYDLFFNRCDLLTQFLLYAHKELTLLRQHSNTFCLNDDIRQGLSENFSLAKGLQLQDIQQDFFGDMNAVMTKLESFINFYQLNSAESSCCYQLASGMPILNIAEQLDTDVWQVQRLINRLRKKTHFVSVDELKLKLQFMEH